MIEYIWEVKVKHTPLLKRKCNRCNSDRFYCSNNFRVNAQKKYIDVWLIYRCVDCDSTYNLTILSRTKPELIKKDLLLKFLENDEDLAWEYAFSAETVRKNDVGIDYGNVEYEILHDDISLNTASAADDEIIKIEVRMPFGFGLKLSSLIRLSMGLSANQFNRMVEAGAIYTPENYPLKKHKVRNGDIVIIDKKKLKNII